MTEILYQSVKPKAMSQSEYVPINAPK